MHFVVLNEMYPKMVLYQNIVNVNIMKSLAYAVRKNLKQLELVNGDTKEGAAMSLINRLNDDMKQAMRVKDKEKLSVIRMVKASLQNEAIHLGVDTLEDDDELTILSRELKQRNDSLIEFKQAGRDDLVEKIEKEIEILQIYMPEQLTEDEIEAIIIQAIKDTNATSKKEFGKVMGTVMPKVKGKADGKIVQKLVQKHLK